MSEIKTNKISPRKGTTQTIGDSGDTVSIPCGVTTTNAGTISTAGITGGTIDNQGTITGLQGVINWDTTAKTTNFNASSQAGYFVNTTSGAITVTFPASPSAGNVIGIKDYALTADTNAITINPNGNNINGSSSNYIINTEGSAAHFIYVDATRGWVLTDASKASDIAEDLKFVTATGGTVTCCGDYKIHTFTGPGTFCVSCAGNAAGSNTVDYLVIAGGGSGGPAAYGSGGGGGGGGFRESSGTASGCYTASPLGACVSALPVTVTGYPITVGGGGSPGPLGSGNNGSNSVFSTITSAGGGGSANPPGAQPGAGGSGGGSVTVCASGGTGNTPPVSPPQGNDGGTGAPTGSSREAGGGGGGATAAGSNGSIPGPGGPGGDGATTSISASPTAYAGGGGGGKRQCAESQPGGTGGTGGGGKGGQGGPNSPAPTFAVAGTTNTGGGGGGGGYQAPLGGGQGGAAGGSGIVIIRYKYQ